MDPKKPALFGDAADVTKWWNQVWAGTVKPIAAKVVEAVADVAIDVLKAEIEQYTPDQVDAVIEQVAQQLKDKAHEVLAP